MRTNTLGFALALVLGVTSAHASTLAGATAPAQTCPADSSAGANPDPLTAPKGVTLHYDLAYARNGHARQKLDLYVPQKKSSNKAGYPVIVYIHGGGWKHGNKESSLLPLEYASMGYAVASVDYRFSSDAVFPAQIQDVKAAVRWLRANAATYGLDPDRFAAWGESAGAHLASLLGTSAAETKFDVGANLDQSSAVLAVVDYYGPTDLLQMDAHLVSGGSSHDGECSAESQLIGGALQEHPKAAQRANPISYLSPKRTPAAFLIAHGDSDTSVPPHQSELLRAALTDIGQRPIYISVTGAGHNNFTNATSQQLADIAAKTRRFLDGRLGG